MAIGAALVAVGQPAAPPLASLEERLARHRNLGKAFYENPAAQNESVAEFRKALALAPRSVREKLNLGLALLRAANNVEGLKYLEEVQRLDPKLPHTWFNLGIHWKKQGEAERAVAQFRRLVELAPREAKAHYNLGAALKLAGDNEAAVKSFEQAMKLDPLLAAARFQLFNGYRALGRTPEAQAQLKEFQRLKKEQEGAAIPEDVDWCDYAEIYDPAPEVRELPSRPVYQARTVLERANGFLVFDALGLGKPEVLGWGPTGVHTRTGRVAADPDVRDAAAADFDNDGLMDLCLVTPAGAKLLKNAKGSFTPVALNAAKGADFRTLVWIDFDHDYDLDLILLGGGALVLRNQGAAGFAPFDAAIPFEKGVAVRARVTRRNPDSRAFDLQVQYQASERENGRTVLYRDQLGGVYRAEPAAAMPAQDAVRVDLNGDGLLDQIRLEQVGLDQRKLIAEVDTAKPVNHWLRVALTGVRNAKLAPDAYVEVKAGTLYRRERYAGLPLTFNVGTAALVDTVRITWPNGLIQNETNLAVDRAYSFKEAQRLSGSCPIIWTWDGERFRYITDVLGVAPLGAAAGDGSYFATDSDEVIQIPGEALQAVDGRFQIRVTEELSEAAYLDRVQLFAVDHPADTDLAISDKWKAPPFPEFERYEVRGWRRPSRVVDHDGSDVTDRLQAADRTYPTGFQRTMSGIAEMHALTIEFAPDAEETGPSLLVLHGWVDWADGSTFLQAAQEGKGGLMPPRLQVQDPSGQWVTVIEDMGMPAGKPKTIAVDLTGKWRSRSRAVRILTNLCVYWDSAALAREFTVSRDPGRTVPLKQAILRFRGFSPSVIHPTREQPERFTYENPEPVSLWNPTPGFYTRYGGVLPLLDRRDDRLTVMGSGDEIALEFDAAALPPAAPGLRRDYLLKVDGWAKDRDANTWSGQRVEPLPFRAMKGYAEDQTGHPDAAYQREWNTRPALRLLRPLE